MPWRGTKDDMAGLERYKQQQAIKLRNKHSVTLKILIKTIYENFTEYFDDGIIMISGSFIYDKLGLIKREYFGDLDLNVKKGSKIGDDFILGFKKFTENCPDLTFYDMNIRDDLSASAFLDEGSIDIYRDDWNESEVMGKCELFPGVFTYYCTTEHMTRNILKTYNFLWGNTNTDNKERRLLKIIKHRTSLKELLKSGELSNSTIKEINDLLNEPLR